MSAPKPAAVTIFPWLKANLGKGCLAPLTGTDARALKAAVEIINLYNYAGHRDLLEAFATVVYQMQPHCQQFAFHAIAHVMDWHNRQEIWEMAGLPFPEPISKCAAEPGGSLWLKAESEVAK